MSREVRRVPLEWKHPTEYNPYWLSQSRPFLGKVRPPSRLHDPRERFVGLCGDYPAAYEGWETELREMKAREGHGWTFAVEYHLTGYKGRNDDEPTSHPYYTYGPDGETEIETVVRDEDHLYELEVAKVEAEKPDPADYMPVFGVPEAELGWCLYETVSEGTPTTPVFATAEELIEHLATVGQDYEQVPMRRAAAEALVGQGHSFGSMVAVGGRLYNSSDDADLIGPALSGGSS
jgi:hypothetical protein